LIRRGIKVGLILALSVAAAAFSARRDGQVSPV
jgi:hypothetical protein